MKSRILLAAVAATLPFAAGCGGARPLKGRELAGQARVSLPRARSIALRARPGRLTGEELDKQDGGSGLRYAFDIRAQGEAYEVGVDAVTGAVLENGRE